MQNNYGLLLWKIEKTYKTKKAFCEAVKVSTKTFKSYIDGETAMPSAFIAKACQLLDIPNEEIGLYFFTVDAGKSPQAV